MRAQDRPKLACRETTVPSGPGRKQTERFCNVGSGEKQPRWLDLS